MLADEGGYAWATRSWVNGSGTLYDDIWISRPQGIFYVYAGIFNLFGTGTTAFRFAAWIAIALTLVAIWAYARMYAGPVAALTSAAIFAVASASPNLEGYSANAEMFMGFPAALAAAWLLFGVRHGFRRWHLVAIGILLGAAITLKPSAAVMVPVAAAFLVLPASGSERKHAWQQTGWIIVGVALIGIASLIDGWMIGWHNFVYATMTYRLTAQSAATVGLAYNLEAIGRLALRALPLLLLVVLLLALKHRRGAQLVFQATRSRGWRAGLSTWRRSTRTSIGRCQDAHFLLQLWLVAAIAGASVGGDWWAHYLIQLVAPLSIWIGVTLCRLLHAFKPIPTRTLLATAVILLLLPYRVLLAGGTTAMTQEMFSHPGYPAQADVAAYLRTHSPLGTTIYVAFDQASIYYLADRPPAYRHLYDQELRGIPSSYADLIAIIRGPNPPMFIVGTRQPGPFADESRAFWSVVGQYYELVETIDGVPIYQSKATITAPAG